MSWMVVARKDFQDAVRSKSLWAVSLVFVLLTAGPAYALGWLSEGALDATVYVSILAPAAGFLVSFVALLVGHRSIVGERETGTVKLLLSLPHTRRDVLIGKVAGRAAVVGAATLIAFGLTALVLLGTFDEFSISTYLAFVVVTLTFALAFTALAVSLSASTDSGTKVSAGVFGLYVVFAFNLWNWLPNLVNYLVNRQLLFLTGEPNWATFVTSLNPTVAYERAVSGLVLGSSEFGNAPVYLSGGAAFTLLVLWIVVPMLLGYWRFSRAEL